MSIPVILTVLSLLIWGLFAIVLTRLL